MQHLSRYARTDWFGPLAITLVSIIVIGALHPGFLSPYNVQVLLLALAVNTLIALSQMVIIAIGQMNLAVGAIGGLAAISFAGMMEVWGLPAPLAGVLAICLGVAAGMLNGALITWSGISAFVITLAGLSVFKGINLGITRAQPFYGVPESVKAFGNTTFLGPLPWIIIPTAIVAVALWYLLNRLPLGRQILAVGGNSSAAELSGISVSRTVIVTHAISGSLAALAGIILVARLQIGQPTIGDEWLILSFAAPVIGGAVLSGGHVSVAGTVLGVAIVAIITQALVLLHIDPFLVQVALGGLILWAVGINRMREVRMERALKRI
jgi:ribose transport system permease protein